MSWRLTYLIFVLLRLYFTLSPSYIHPDEHFQGPEVIAGEIFGWNTTKTWEFTSDQPIRSIVPLWLAYGIPMTILRWFQGSDVSPYLVYYCLRIFFFIVSFSLEDWALQELGSTQKVRAHYLLCAASSYITWTFQTHTFSNSVETVVLAWALVLIKRISSRNFGHSSHFWSCVMLGALVSLGVFNRITFPAFLVLPCLYLVPKLLKYPVSIALISVSAVLTSLIAIYIDTRFYGSPGMVITPLNSFLYNSDPDNLAKHGLHPRYTHFLINLPQLLGPYLFFTRPQLSIPFLSALSGTAMLSFFRHQEARFLLPAIPLYLTTVKFPNALLLHPGRRRMLLGVFGAFNLALAMLFGVYHQGGVVPTQAAYIGPRLATASDVVWWRTYSPPDWLLGRNSDLVGYLHRGGVDNATAVVELVKEADAGGGVRIWDMMGSDGEVVDALVAELVRTRAKSSDKDVLVVAPLSASGLYKFLANPELPYYLHLEYSYAQHINMDDFGVDYEEARYHKRRQGESESEGEGEGEEGLGFWDKARAIAMQNRPGLGVWSVVMRAEA